MNDEVRDAFLRDVASAVRYWNERGVELLESAADDGSPSPASALQSSLQGVAHSILVVLDGGTTMSDHGRQAWLTDRDGSPIGEGLHEWLFNYL